MAQTIAKTVTITGTNTDGDTVELLVPSNSQKLTGSNDMTGFSRPNEQPPVRKGLNMNRWEFALQITAKVTDRFADKNHDGSGDRPELSNKEDWLNELYKLTISQEIITYSASNDNTRSNVSDWSGYIHNLDFTEKANTDNSVYDVTIKIVDEEPMQS